MEADGEGERTGLARMRAAIAKPFCLAGRLVGPRSKSQDREWGPEGTNLPISELSNESLPGRLYWVLGTREASRLGWESQQFVDENGSGLSKIAAFLEPAHLATYVRALSDGKYAPVVVMMNTQP